MADARNLWIEGPAGKLEAALRVACPARAAVVLAHPHPLYGGTIHNPIVFRSDRELHRRDMTTLRFNFRGAGKSEGSHDEGRGEVEDLGAALSWLRGTTPGVPLVLFGYSFGAWCALRHAPGDDSVSAVVAVGLPVRLYEFREIAELGRPLAVVQGSRDEFGSPEEVGALLRSATPPGTLHVIPDAPHTFPGRAVEVATKVADAVEECLRALP